jgi:hypothetical protein
VLFHCDAVQAAGANPPMASVKVAFLRGDNSGEVRYRIYADGRFVGSTAGNQFSVPGLSAGKPHTLIPSALDIHGQIIAISTPAMLSYP